MRLNKIEVVEQGVQMSDETSDSYQKSQMQIKIQLNADQAATTSKRLKLEESFSHIQAER